MFNSLDGITKSLQEILVNFKKNPNRQYTATHVLKKVTLVKNLYESFKEINISIREALNKEEIQILDLKVNIFKTIYKEVNEILRAKTTDTLNNSLEEEENKNIDQPEVSIMATFNLALSNKLIPEFDGNKDNLNNFLNLIEYMCDSLTTDVEKKKLIKFVLRTKISDRLRFKIQSFEEPENLTSLKHTLDTICKGHITPLKIQSDLLKCSQGNLSLIIYANKIEDLTMQLNDLSITNTDKNVKDALLTVNDALALNTFKAGLNEPLRTTIYAAKPSTLQDAIKLAQEIDSAQISPKHVFTVNRGQRNQYNNYRYGNGQTRYNNNSHNLRYQHYNRNSRNNYRNNNVNNSNRNVRNNTNRYDSNRNYRVNHVETSKNEETVSDIHLSRDLN